MNDATYILPIRDPDPARDDDLARYLRWLGRFMQVVVVDNSTEHDRVERALRWSAPIEVIPPDPDLRTANGKVGNVLTGIRRARHERVVIADDDVRYDSAGLLRMLELLDQADVVRPQNYFAPAPWHAQWDTARSLLNRMSGGDWPGTLGVRRSTLERAGGYDGDVLFENLELVRTVRAAGGRELVAADLYVRRLPPSAGRFWSQRIRQAYDEFARPARLAVSLALLPVAAILLASGLAGLLVVFAIAVILLAEIGRRRQGGEIAFPSSAALFAPLWLAERALCAWIAVGARLFAGGICYRGKVLRRAASSEAELRGRRLACREVAVRVRT